jgi:hypothetical protein
MNFLEARAALAADLPMLADRGIFLQPQTVSYATDEAKRDYTLAADAQPGLITTPNAGVPSFLQTMIDPTVFEVLLTPNKAAEIIGEVRKGTWLDNTALFPTIERTGEVSTYGDYSENGHTGVNTEWPQRQAYLFQTIKEYGDRELELAGLARINFVAEIDRAAAVVLAKFHNLTYFFGLSGLQNYGLLNDPTLTASLTPATKAAGGVKWVTAANAINATANEVFADVQSLVIQLIQQSNGLIEVTDPFILAMAPAPSVALTATNSYNVNVSDLLRKNFPAMRVVTAMQYGALSASNPQGLTGGNLVQLIAPNVEGQEVGYAAFNEKMRAHPLFRALSSYKQKVTGGTWGAVIRQPFAIASMLGV